MKSTSVAIIGAGPVGISAALRLAALGVDCVLVEAEAATGGDLRASTFHPPTLEMLDTLGLAEPLIAAGLITPDWQVRMHETAERAVFDLATIATDTRYPFRLQCEQSTFCTLGLARARTNAAVEVLMEHRLVTLKQDADRVTLGFDNGETMHARYVVGADGARSVVRQAIGVGFEGFTYPETTILATTHMPFENHLEGLSNVNYCWSADGTFSLLRLPHLWRCSLYADPHESLEQATTRTAIAAKLARIVPDVADPEVIESRPYRIHQRIVTDYRAGRVALAGDSAHLNSPSGGMGMNGGIHDAFALADVLHALLGGADERLLDRYTRRRKTIAQDQILEQAHRNRTRMQERDGDRRREELTRLQRIAADPVACRQHLLRSSMIDGLRQAEQIA